MSVCKLWYELGIQALQYARSHKRSEDIIRKLEKYPNLQLVRCTLYNIKDLPILARMSYLTKLDLCRSFNLPGDVEDFKVEISTLTILKAPVGVIMFFSGCINLEEIHIREAKL